MPLAVLDDDVHVFSASIDCAQPVLEDFEATLAVDEQAYASRLAFSRDRDRFIARRGILRTILGRYLQRPPAAIEFDYEPRGKPRLRIGASDPPIRFNQSHSHGLAVFAFSRNRELGVDVEAIRPEMASEEIAERIFSANELAMWRALPPVKRVEAFFLGWTRKEAYAKALGLGLGLSFHSIEVNVACWTTQSLIGADTRGWVLRTFLPDEGYMGAIAAEGTGWSLHLSQWTSGYPSSTAP